MLDALIRWNRWGAAELSSGIERDITKTLIPFLNSKEVVILTGPRQTGKSTILYQIMDLLEKNKIDKKALLHVNFEEPVFSSKLNLELLDELYDNYRADVFPEGKAYLFLDEIQNIPEWERWVRARNQTEDVKIFITGSSSKLMSSEFSTLLTGRHVSFVVYPLDFKEFLEFKNISIPKKPMPFEAPPIIKNALNQYLKWGAFPEIVLAEDDFRKEKLLTQYFDDILFKDIALRHKIRNLSNLRMLAVHLLTNTSSLISFKRIANQFQVSEDLAQTYCTYLSDAYLVKLVSLFSNKVAERKRNPHKVHAIDLGLRQVVSLANSADKGKLIETAVHNKLIRQKQDGVFYWKNGSEIDLLKRKGTAIEQLIQVVYENLHDEKVFKRETSALIEAQKHFPKAEKKLIVYDVKQKVKIDQNLNTEIIPLWKFLISE